MLFSYHAQYERADRIEKLEEVLGFTKIVLEVPVVEEEKRYCLTSSGVLIVKNLYRDFVITAFMCNVDQCYRLYRMAGKAQMSPKMYKRVTKNIERHSELFYIQALTNTKSYGII